MNKYTYLPGLLLLTPVIALAQSPLTPSFQNLFTNLLLFINSTLVPFLLGIGFLFIAINVVRYFIIGGSSEEGREKAKSLAIYGVGAFVFLLVFWGIVNMIANSIGLSGCRPVQSDYVQLDATGPAAPNCL